ncbi:MAG: peptide ABC transporter substrate-binding protein [Deltaproteobacteria bacterium CG11_big_fil_rev_8_21_14_0_20_47_16]|nr:MAG: peptide ABC transporter substrate-binding protein [Deltaproteobacteria bacterium CG11_big_fil_rev_8_21_14_0_20_47_16]
MSTKPLLEVQNLAVHFPVESGGLLRKQVGLVRAVDDVSFHINAGETVGLVGESGCGKSTTGRAIMQLIEATSGRVLFEGKDLRQMPHAELTHARRNFQMIFQDPYASLNPRKTVGDAVGEPIKLFGTAGGKSVNERVQEVFHMVGLNPRYIRRYPHEFSGGQRQRIGIARALAANPKLIIADEPISALDVSIQAQILNLMTDLQEQLNLTYLFISHDLAAVRHISQRIIVMYLGKIVEVASYEAIYSSPKHPYTQALLSAVPIPDPVVEKQRRRQVLVGDIPNPINPPTGCAFHPRCPLAMAHCKTVTPKLQQTESGHWVSCHLYDK